MTKADLVELVANHADIAVIHLLLVVVDKVHDLVAGFERIARGLDQNRLRI